MTIENLSVKEQDIVRRCMNAAGSLIEDWEKHTRLGMGGDELHRTIAQWPNIDDVDLGCSGFLAINNCMNEVCNGLRIGPGEWHKWFDTPMADVKATYRKWLALAGISGGVR